MQRIFSVSWVWMLYFSQVHRISFTDMQSIQQLATECLSWTQCRQFFTVRVPGSSLPGASIGSNCWIASIGVFSERLASAERYNFSISFCENTFYPHFDLHLFFKKLISKNWFRKTDLEELHFLVFITACVARKIQVRNRPKMELVEIHFSKIKCRSTVDWTIENSGFKSRFLYCLRF